MPTISPSEQEGGAPHRHDRVAQRDRHGGSHHLLDQRGIRRHARGDFAGAVFLEEAGSQPQQIGLNGKADVGHNPFAQPRHRIEPHRRADSQNHHDANQTAEPVIDHRRVAATGKPLIDDHAKAGGNGQCGRSGDHQRHAGGNHPRGIGHRRAPDHPQRPELADARRGGDFGGHGLGRVGRRGGNRGGGNGGAGHGPCPK